MDMRTCKISLVLTAAMFGCGSSGSPTTGIDATSTHDAPVTVTIDSAPGTIDAPRSAPDAAGACGVCPTDSTCGTMNGSPVCITSTGIPRLKHVFVIMMENTSLSTLQGQSSTDIPFLSGLLTTGSYSSDYHGVAHPSLPNYLALVSGSTDDVKCDCKPTGNACSQVTCNAILSSCGCPQTADHIGDQIEAANRTWRAYGEDMGSACNTATSGNYAARHVPFVYFSTLTGDSARCNSHVVDFANDATHSFATDLAGSTPDLVYIAPNLTDDMHNPVPASTTNYTNGDTWLASIVPTITASPAYLDDGMLLIVWDEDDLSGVIAADDPIPMFVLSPLAKTPYQSATHADHYAVLATIEDALGLPRLGAAAQATPLADFFPAN